MPQGKVCAATMAEMGPPRGPIMTRWPKRKPPSLDRVGGKSPPTLRVERAKGGGALKTRSLLEEMGSE